MTALLIKTGREPADKWIAEINKSLPDLDIRIWPDAGNRDEVEFILANDLPPGEFATFPNLRFIATTRVGLEQLLKDPDVPAEVPILRQRNLERAATMSGWIIYHVLRHHRRFDDFEANQTRKQWEMLDWKSPTETRIGMMGLGGLSAPAAVRLADLMYVVAGWSRTAKDIPGVADFVGDKAFYPFLERTDILVSLLPNTRKTQGLLDARAFARLPEGAYVINVGRGSVLDEDALLAAIDSGHLSGAALDVFQTEPLPTEHPFWSHPKVTVTPHYACQGRAEFSTPHLIDNIRRSLAGEPLSVTADKAEGY